MAKSQINFGELGGGGDVNPTIIQNWSQSAQIDYNYTVDLSKTYLVCVVFKQGNITQYDAVVVIKNGVCTYLLGDAAQGIVLMTDETTLHIGVGSVTYVKYIVFMQLD